jgi:hypothetical protein
MTELARSGTPSRQRARDRHRLRLPDGGPRAVADAVYSVERIAPLAARARQTLHQLRIANVRIKHADGTALVDVDLKFDAIVVTAAAKFVPGMDPLSTSAASSSSPMRPVPRLPAADRDHRVPNPARARNSSSRCASCRCCRD